MERRNTKQKELVLNAVNTLMCHATADEVYLQIKEQYPAISKGTVYRNLNILAEEGKIKRIEMPNEADRFDHTTGNHYHIKCIKCGMVYDVDPCDIGSPLDLVKDKKGFDFRDCSIVFKGICPKCK